MRTALALTGLLLSTLLPSAALSQEGKASLLGRYTITSGQEGAKKLAPGELKQDVVHIEKDVITVYDKSKKKHYVASYKLDTAQKPWAIHMTSQVAPIDGVKTDGLIQKDGDTVRLIYALPGGATPTSFEPKEKQMLFTMKRQAEKR